MALELELTTTGIEARVECSSADVIAPSQDVTVDLCIFDPPYYDYIAYDELSAFYRAWQAEPDLAGLPLLPGKGNGAEPFGAYLGRCMATSVARLRRGRPMAFTYHSTKREAWAAIGEALDLSSLRVTAIWPLMSDGHMGHHSHAGNSEWDLLIVCRREIETAPSQLTVSVEEWVEAVRPLRVTDADRKNMTLALAMATPRFATLKGRQNEDRR